MEPTTVIEEVTEVFKEIDERQVSLVLCLIDGATSVLLSNALEWIKVFFDCFSASLSARTTATLREIQCLRVQVN